MRGPMAPKTNVAGARRLRRIGLFISALTAAAAGVLAFQAGVAYEVELDTIDIRFRIRGEQPVDDEVAVVAIDEATLDDFGGRWPLENMRHAAMINRLTRAGVSAIAYDVEFIEALGSQGDSALVPSIRRATLGGTPVVLATSRMTMGGGSGIFGDGQALTFSGASVGDARHVFGPDWVVRNFRGADKGVVGFATASVEAASGEAADIDSFPDGGAWIDYRGNAGTIPTYSFADVLDGSITDEQLRDRIVVVGPTASTLIGTQGTPFGTLISSSEIHANAISTELRGQPLTSAPGPIELVLIVALGLFAPALAFKLRPPYPFVCAVGAGIGFLFGAQVVFNAGWIISIVPPLIALSVGAVGALFTNLGISLFERARMRETFARFVPPDVVDAVLERADDDLRLGGMRCDSTNLFCDLRGFTTFSETTAPEELFTILNCYLDEMTNAIMDHGGTLVSYLGDGIIAVFGAPLSQADHADRAIRAAREMLDQRLPAFNQWLAERGYEKGFEMGVGINSGDIFSGQVGSSRRMDYTTIGDTTNTASRLEGMTKNTPHAVFFSEATRQRLTADPDDLIEIGERLVRGRERPIQIWSIEAGVASRQSNQPQILP